MKAVEQLREFSLDPSGPIIIGVTGGIGAGKTAVSGSFANLGAKVVDADKLARQVVEPGAVGLERVVETFGSELLTPRGELDRVALAQVVFSDTEQLEVLETILHPLIGVEAQRQFSSLLPGQIGIYDVPLLIEKDMSTIFDLVVVVEAPMELRLERLENRGMPRGEAEKRILSQADDAQRRKIAHLIVNNSGSQKQLNRAVKYIWDHILAL